MWEKVSKWVEALEIIGVLKTSVDVAFLIV